MAFVIVRHNIEVAHRLSLLEGKCEAIHGHSMMVDLQIFGQVDSRGLLDGLEFGLVKKRFREHLDTTYDHHLLLNESDPWAQDLFEMVPTEMANPDGGPGYVMQDVPKEMGKLPGLRTTPGDPTTENISRWVARWAAEAFQKTVDVLVQETHVNFAGTSARPINGS
jgi:6-pyruvoyl-tetrahydropterin synthase